MRTKYSIRNSITSIITNIITFVFLFIGQTILIKIMGIEYNGLNGLFSNILTILNLFELGIGSAVTYILYKYIKTNDKEIIKAIINFYKSAYNYISIIIFIVGLSILPFLKYIIKDISIDINIYIVYILFLFTTISTYLLSYKRNLLFANQKKYILNIIHIVYIIVLNISQIIIIYLTHNYYLYLLIKIICNIIENLIVNYKTNKLYSFIKEKSNKLENNIKKDIITRVRALIIHKVSTAITNGTDNILISSFFGLTTVGIYTSYNYIISTIKTVFNDIIFSVSASVGNLLVEKDYQKNYTAFKKIIFLNYWIAIVTSTCLLFLIEPFIKIWLGSEYLLNNLVLIILIINYFQTIMRSTYSTFKDAAGIWIEDKYVPLLQLSINLISSIVLLKLIGLAGIFLGTIISSFAVWFYSYPKYIYKDLLKRNYKEYIINMIKSILLFAFIEIIVYLIITNIIISNLILNLILRLFICIILSSFILFIFYNKSSEYKYFKNLIFKFKKNIK